MMVRPDIQNLQIPGEDRCFLKAGPEEMFGASNIDPHQVFGCLGAGRQTFHF